VVPEIFHSDTIDLVLYCFTRVIFLLSGIPWYSIYFYQLYN